MGLHNTAHYLRSKGRGEDTELVHMTKGEVKGLQQLALAHGGTLTINPDTGLVEAGFLSRMLPTVAGIAAGAITMNPMVGAAVAGGLTMATGGSLTQGLLAGVGAYGGAGMVSGLAEAGATQLAAESASQAVQETALKSGMQQFGANQVIPTETGNLFLPNGSAQASINIGSAMPEAPIFSNAAQAANAFNSGAISADQYANFASEYAQRVPAATGADIMTMQNLKQGIGIGPQGFSPTNLATNVYDLVKKDPTQAAMTAAPLLTNMNTNRQQLGPTDEYKSSISPNFRAYVPGQPDPYYRAQYPTYNTGGIADIKTPLPRGDAGINRDDSSTTRPMSALDATNYRNKKLLGRFGMPVAAMPQTGIKSLGGDFSDAAAQGGTASLGGYSDGGRMLKGPGDGMSDSIPGVIANKQPARLADGEFVVPADVVSHLGNGSTDAGARKLYSMMDKIRRARTGRKKQAPEVKTNKFLPA